METSSLILNINYLQKLKKVKIGTLGPEGTSSEQAALFFQKRYLNNKKDTSKIILLDTFEECSEKLDKKDLDLVIVPHAYQFINKFYMKRNIDLIEIFKFPTPMYGLATREDYMNSKNQNLDRIVTHPAPLSLLDDFLNNQPLPKISYASSTSQAARLVAEGQYNLAITNEVARKKYNLKFIYKFKKIPMSWSVFGVNNNGK